MKCDSELLIVGDGPLRHELEKKWRMRQLEMFFLLVQEGM